MKSKLKILSPILLFLGLGIFFGIVTNKLYWYIPSGLIIGVLISIAFNKN